MWKRSLKGETVAEIVPSWPNSKRIKNGDDAVIVGVSGFVLFWPASLKSSPAEGILIVRLLLLS